MKSCLVAICAAALLASCTTVQPVGTRMPVVAESGDWIHIKNAVATKTDGPIVVYGDAMLLPSRQGPVTEHIHVDAVDASGVILLTKDAPWNTILSLRSRNRATFRAEFQNDAALAAFSFRIRLVDGALHQE